MCGSHLSDGLHGASRPAPGNNVPSFLGSTKDGALPSRWLFSAYLRAYHVEAARCILSRQVSGKFAPLRVVSQHQGLPLPLPLRPPLKPSAKPRPGNFCFLRFICCRQGVALSTIPHVVAGWQYFPLAVLRHTPLHKGARSCGTVHPGS